MVWCDEVLRVEIEEEYFKYIQLYWHIEGLRRADTLYNIKNFTFYVIIVLTPEPTHVDYHFLRSLWRLFWIKSQGWIVDLVRQI